MKKSNPFIFHAPLILFLLTFCTVFAYKTVARPAPFFDWDEAIYAQVGKEMLRSGSWLVPVWQGKPWLDKPPLPSLVYGLAFLVPLQPEITTRLITIALSAVVLGLLYLFAYRHTKSRLIALATAYITTLLPLFTQRVESLNVDVFLLVGWLGYFLFYSNLAWGTVFALIGVLSKSLLGLYPLGVVIGIELVGYLLKQKTRKSVTAQLKKIAIHFSVSVIWFVGMYIFYGQEFIKLHFLESHLKRVTASIEQHFGQRTFYIDVLLEQVRWLIVPIVLSAAALSYRIFTKKKCSDLFSVSIVPWFVFLNLTKTKIAWYLYPVLPQFALLSVYGATYIHNRRVRIGVIFGLCALVSLLLYNPAHLMNTAYSRWEDHQLIAVEAQKNRCKQVFVLVNEGTRTSYKTLKSMNLVITTTTWWGNHPSIAYYADAPTRYAYALPQMQEWIMKNTSTSSCFIFEHPDPEGILFPYDVKKVSNASFSLFIRK